KQWPESGNPLVDRISDGGYSESTGAREVRGRGVASRCFEYDYTDAILRERTSGCSNLERQRIPSPFSVGQIGVGVERSQRLSLSTRRMTDERNLIGWRAPRMEEPLASAPRTEGQLSVADSAFAEPGLAATCSEGGGQIRAYPI